jgi:hypothetical protein
MKKSFFFALALMLLGLIANAQVLMTTTGSYYQDFNTLINTGSGTWSDNSTLPSWWANRTGTGTTIAAGTGSINTGNLYSFGATSATDRALGSLGSGNVAAGNFAYGVQLQNNSGATITQLSVSYMGEQWRDGGAATPAPQTVAFYYKISPALITTTDPNSNASWTAVTTLDFTSPTYVNLTSGNLLDGNLPANRVFFGAVSIPSLSIPTGSYIMLKWDDPNQTGNDHGLAIDSVTISWTVGAVVPAVTTGTIAGSPYCITATNGASVSVPYTITGTFNTGNMFKAYLSDATGSFASETEIGTITSQVAGTISATIPAGTPSGTGYRIRVKATDPITVGTDNGSDLTVVLGTPQVNNAYAYPGNTQVTLNWDNPASCMDELMIVAKPVKTIYSSATGNGSLYTANSSDFTDALNSVFDTTGAVIYKSLTPGNAVTVTGLTNGTNYYFRFFVRKDTSWNKVVEVNATPQDLPNIVITEIMYNDPSSGNDSLEFIELYNNGPTTANMSHWTFSAGVVYTFPAGTFLSSGSYLVVAKTASIVNTFFGISGTLEWTSGTLLNTGELLEIKDTIGNVIDSLTYLPSAPWPTSPNGGGPSLTLCDPNDNNALGISWSASVEFADSVNHVAVYANPGGGCIIPPDVTPPVALSAYAASLSNVVVVFNEALDLTTAETEANYTFLTAATGTATLRPTLDSVYLTLSTPLVTGITDTISITGIEDLVGNPMTLTYKFPIVFGTASSGIDTIVYWNFPSTSLDQVADGGLPVNLTKTISRESAFAGTYSYPGGSPSQAISSTTWDSGNGVKFWQAEFSTWLYDSIRFSSKQYSSSTGPRDFTVQYSLDGSVWSAVAGTTVKCAASWAASGRLNNILLPAACYSKNSVYLRWIMTSDSSVNLALVQSGGTDRIDEIYVTGRYNPLLGVQCEAPINGLQFSVYPNPSSGSFIIQLGEVTDVKIDILNLTGQCMKSVTGKDNIFKMDLSDLSKGIYLIRITNQVSMKQSYNKIILH